MVSCLCSSVLDYTGYHGTLFPIYFSFVRGVGGWEGAACCGGLGDCCWSYLAAKRQFSLLVLFFVFLSKSTSFFFFGGLRCRYNWVRLCRAEKGYGPWTLAHTFVLVSFGWGLPLSVTTTSPVVAVAGELLPKGSAFMFDNTHEEARKPSSCRCLLIWVRHA